jgi:DNA polymerase I
MRGLDVETTSLNPDEGDLRLVQIGDESRVRVMDAFFMSPSTLKEAIDEEDDLVAHNATFEAAWLRAKLGAAPTLDDTMIMSQVYHTGTKAAKRSNFGHSLAAVVKRELKRELSKDEQQSDWGSAALTREQLEYAALDAAVLPPLADRLLTKIDKVGLRKVYELELRVSHAIDAMQRRGVAIHTDRLDEMIEESTERAERLKAELTEEWGINPGSGKQLIEHFGLEGRKGWP